MSTALFMLSLVLIAALTIALLDWYARRKDRQSKDRRSA
jgi:hypothetical protein